MALQGATVDRRHASFFSPVVGGQGQAPMPARQQPPCLCRCRGFAAVPPRVPPLHAAHRVSPSSYVPNEPLFPTTPSKCYAAPAFKLSPPVLHHATCRAKSGMPRLRHQPHRRAKHAASLPPVMALASSPQATASGAAFWSPLQLGPPIPSCRTPDVL
jgi:hypothetical protein